MDKYFLMIYGKGSKVIQWIDELDVIPSLHNNIYGRDML